MIFQNLITKFKDFGLSEPKILSKATFFTVSVILIAHFLLIANNLLPENPIQHQYKFQLQNYTNPFFSQTWTLFAPNPVNSNMSLLYQFAYSSNNSRDTTKWLDVTKPLIEIRKKDFWSPAQRISKFMTSSMIDINKVNSDIIQFIQKTDSLKNDSLKASKFIKKRMRLSYGHQSLIEYAKYTAFKYFQRKEIFPEKLKVRYKVFKARFPRFSERKLDYYNLDNYEFHQITSDFVNIKL